MRKRKTRRKGSRAGRDARGRFTRGSAAAKRLGRKGHRSSCRRYR